MVQVEEERRYALEPPPLQQFEDMLDIWSAREADRYVLEVLQTTIESQKIQLVEALTCQKFKKRRKRRRSPTIAPRLSRGGSPDQHDYRIYNFLQLIDTCHDFVDKYTSVNDIITSAFPNGIDPPTYLPSSTS